MTDRQFEILMERLDKIEAALIKPSRSNVTELVTAGDEMTEFLKKHRQKAQGQ